MQHVYSSPKSVTSGVRPCPLAMQHFYSCVSQACHWWCPPFSAGHVAFLFVCLPGLSRVPLAMQHVYSSPRSVTAGVRPCPLAMQHFYSCVSQACHWWCPPFLVSALFRWPCSISIYLSPRSVTAGVSPFPLGMQQFYSFVFQVCHCWCPPFSAGHAAFLFICFPGL